MFTNSQSYNFYFVYPNMEYIFLHFITKRGTEIHYSVALYLQIMFCCCNLDVVFTDYSRDFKLVSFVGEHVVIFMDISSFFLTLRSPISDGALLT